MKTEIIPAILPKDFAELEDKISLIRGLVQTVQIDVCDGQFTPSPSWPYRKHDDSFEKIKREEKGFPGWEEINFEIDLMVNHPEEVVEDWIKAGAQRVVLHVESKGDIEKAVTLLDSKVEIGLAINIDTSLDAIVKFSDKIQFIQCMGIDRIGFQGQGFDPRVVEKVKELRSKYSNLPISVDGGVSLLNAQSLIRAGASRLVVGSSIFNSDNIFEVINKFKKVS